MGKKVFLGAIVGAIVAFVWSFISWMVLPWHEWTFQSFRNEEFIGWVIKENTKKDGVYIIPKVCDEKSSFNSKELKGKSSEGPFVYAQIKRKGIDYSRSKYHIIAFLTQFIGATLIGILLLQASSLKYGGRLSFITLVGVIIGVLGHVPNWNWFGGGTLFLLVTLADLTITWFLAGLLMAAIIKPKPKHLPM